MKNRVSLGPLAIILVLASAAPGCRERNPWGGWLRPSHSPHEQVTTAIPEAEPPSSPVSGLPVAAANPVNSVHVVDLAFDVLRTDVPLGSIQHSRKIFSHVDELRVDPGLVGRLARNGLRIGIVSEESWPAIQTILEAAEANARKEQLLAQSSLPVALEVGTIRERESIFSYGPNNRLAGKSFAAGKKVVNVDYAIHPGMPGQIDLQVTLEVRHDRGVMTWERTATGIRQVPERDRHVYGDLRTAVVLNRGESLVIGPSEEAQNEYLLGSRFFTERRPEGRYETLYWITPIPYQRSAAWQQGP